MPIDPEKLAEGRALVTGGALPANPLAAVIEAAREAFHLGRDPANWPDHLLAALGDVDSALEISAARAAVIRDKDSAIAQARESNSDLRAALARADSDIARLQGDCTREGERAVEAEKRLERIAGELRGITLGQLARMGSYGASLAAAFMESAND